MLSIKKSVSKLFCLTLSNYSKKYNIHIYLPSSQEFDIINPNFINSAVFTSDSYCIPLIMKAKHHLAYPSIHLLWEAELQESN